VVRRCLTSKRERYILLKHFNGKCAKCGVEVGANFHADHIVPFSKTGRTNVHEMQVLCARCNLKKGAK